MQVLLGALAATGLVSIAAWFKRLAPTKTKDSVKAVVAPLEEDPVVAVAEEIIEREAAESKQEIEAALKGTEDKPAEQALSDMLNSGSWK